MISVFLSRKTGAEHPVPQINGTPEQQQATTELHNQFNISTESARIIVKQFMEEMQKGLDHEGATGNKSETM
jgi:hexokinase